MQIVTCIFYVTVEISVFSVLTGVNNMSVGVVAENKYRIIAYYFIDLLVRAAAKLVSGSSFPTLPS